MTGTTITLTFATLKKKQKGLWLEGEVQYCMHHLLNFKKNGKQQQKQKQKASFLSHWATFFFVVALFKKKKNSDVRHSMPTRSFFLPGFFFRTGRRTEEETDSKYYLCLSVSLSHYKKKL